MGRFIQQQIKTFVSRFIPTAWCPNCNGSVSLKNEKDLNEKVKNKRKIREKMQAKEQQFKELFLSEYGRMYKAAYILHAGHTLRMPLRPLAVPW